MQRLTRHLCTLATVAGLMLPAIGAMGMTDDEEAKPAPIVIVPDILDLGAAAPGEKAEGRMWIINVSTTDIVELSKIKTACGCTTVQTNGEIVLGPLQAAPLDVTMKATTSAVRLGAPLTKSVKLFFENYAPMTGKVRVTSQDARVDVLERYSTAVDAGDAAAIAEILAPDSRIWFGKKEGDGTPRRPGGKGPWSEWDAMMNAETTTLGYIAKGDTITRMMRETNDFYRLLERPAATLRITYEFDEQDRIRGTIIAKFPGHDTPSQAGRFDEFIAWARANHPKTIARLYENEEITPSATNAEAWRRLLVRWREATGLEPVKVVSTN